MNQTIAATAAATLAAALLAPVPAAAQTGEPWQFRATIYGYLPTFSGHTTFPAGGGGSSARVDIGDLLDLKFAFMGQFEAHRGLWGVFTDVLYLDLGSTKTGSRNLAIGDRPLPVGASATLDYGLQGWLWTLAGAYRVLAKPNYSLDLIAGGRMLSIDQSLDWQLAGSLGSLPVVDRAARRETSLTNWDAIVGVKGRASFGEGNRWFVPYYLDLGAGESKFTWQGIVGVGYAFGWGDIIAAWRYIDYDMKSGKALEDLSTNGPAIAVSFRW